MLVGVSARRRSELYWKIARLGSRKTRAMTAAETFGVWSAAAAGLDPMSSR